MIFNNIRTSGDIERATRDLLRETGLDSIPIMPEIVAETFNLDVDAVNLGENVSGVLIIQDGKGAIGYNAHQSHVRQRFSIAHELGHYLLHSHKHKLFIDKKYSVFWRDENSSSGENLDEIQANQFAAALLMPKDKLFEELAELDFDVADEEEGEEAITTLARKFDVSTQAMSFRLLRLGLLNS